MGRNEFEKQLKAQLQQREIPPSKDAWDKISRQLEVTETPKPKKLQWYGIAAGFIGLIFIPVLYFLVIGLPTDSEIQITDVKKDSIQHNSIPAIIQEQNNTEEASIVSDKVQEKKSIQNNRKHKPNEIKRYASISSKGQERKEQKVAIPLNASEKLIDIKIAEIVAQVADLEDDNSAVTDVEIDSLLRGAQQQIVEDKIFRKNRSVDATALLADVEDELDQSFRDQIFDALKDGFLKVRTAVADRNK